MNAIETTATELRSWLVRDLVDRHPETMTMLTPFGIDLCCGGGREVGEALELHGAPVDEVLAQIVTAISASESVAP